MVLAGSKGMAGAAILCGAGAFRAGAGLVRICIEESQFSAIHGGLPEATCVARFTDMGGPDKYTAAVIGPGLGVDEKNGLLIKEILRNFQGTAVLDADGLNLLAMDESLIAKTGGRLILTPHPGEAGRLLSCSAKEINRDRTGSALRLAEKYGATAVLKGAQTVVATPCGETYINTTGNPGMATGGSGDVLAGIISALAGQGLRPLQAAAAGVYIHGLAGDMAAEKTGEYGLLASDIAGHTGPAIKAILTEAKKIEEDGFPCPSRKEGVRGPGW